MILSCLIVLVRYDGVTVLAGLVQLLDQYMREGQESKAIFEIFASMEHQRVQPNVITFSSLISACEKAKNPKRALEIFDSIEHQRLQPNVITFSSLISAFEKGKNPELILIGS